VSAGECIDPVQTREAASAHIDAAVASISRVEVCGLELSRVLTSAIEALYLAKRMIRQGGR
jgi:hypothetical protein